MLVKSLELQQMGCLVKDHIFTDIFLKEKECVPTQIQLNLMGQQ